MHSSQHRRQHRLLSHIFSLDYLYFLPAVCAALLWRLLPIPPIAILGLSIWSLPLFTAGAAAIFQKNSPSLFTIIINRSPVQGIFLLGYAFLIFIGFFIILFFANSQGLIGFIGGEIFTALLMFIATVLPLIRIWPDYLLRIIHPRTGQHGLWNSADINPAIGPTVLTSWKYSARAHLPLSTTVNAILSILIIGCGIFLIHTDFCPSNTTCQFVGRAFILLFLFPLAHLLLVKIGVQLLDANDISFPPSQRDKSATPHSVSLPPKKELTVFDKNALIDKRVLEYLPLDNNKIITGWLHQSTQRETNIILAYNQTNNHILIINGPWKVGRWEHESSATDISIEDATLGKYPPNISINQKQIEMVKRYLQNHKASSADKTS